MEQEVTVTAQQSLPERMLEQELAKPTPNLDVLDRLMALQERLERNSNKRAFAAAFALAKAEMPVIIKNRQVGYDSKRTGGSTSYKHADLGEVVDTVTPILAKHGLWHRWQVTTDPITVRVEIGHTDGHVEQFPPWSSDPDATGQKNSQQAKMSAVTYAERYTLMAALGLAAAEDDDGAGAGTALISSEQAADLLQKMNVAGISLERIGKIYGINNLLQLPASQLSAALELVAMTLAKREEKKHAAADG